ncbi:hypothetical protein PWT90_10094 [Aphanocladium album]|nr:hypothetical protein PWT90_10094 [Aphanocladium album]
MTGMTSNSGSSCGVCSLTFDNVGAFRQHAKSPEHVANLRRKAAQSGAEIRATADSESDSSAPYSTSSSDESESEPESSGGPSSTPGFVAEQCLFCDVRSADFDASLVHMASTHSFVVPYQSSLIVDLPTLVWYLHLVIYTYRECVACGSRRRTTAAVQQHMQGKGHCRFDMANPEIRDFYDLSALDTRLVSDLTRPDDGTIRLASGRLISQRGSSQSDGSRSGSTGNNTRKRLERGGASQAEERGETALAVRGGEQQIVLDETDRKMATAAKQMSQLSVRDQQALAHLAPAEQRRELTLRKKQLDRARRAEWRSQAALGRKGNKTLMKTYRAAGPERPLG